MTTRFERWRRARFRAMKMLVGLLSGAGLRFG
jgi:hypothetical protein